MEALNVSSVLSDLRETFATGKTHKLGWRQRQLNRLKTLVIENESRLLDALAKDLGKPTLEAYASEVGYLVSDVDHTLKHLRKWTKPEKVWTPLVNFKGTSRIHREPLGVVLIIGPWNYPVQLLLAPLIGALAAGNCAILKPSELTPACSALVAELIPRYLEPDAVRVVEGGVPETTALLEQKFDYIFFTGSTRVGKIVYKAAAEHLTPVTLELGGKSPCIVGRQVDLPVAARRIAWGKFFNAGQTCVAPDYILVDKAVERPLIDALRRTLREFYGDDPQQSPDLARIVSTGHHQRLVKLLEGETVAVGGQNDEASRYLAPTVLEGVSPDAPIMEEEIFGPILPVIPVESVDAAIKFVNARPKPLALYLFSDDSSDKAKVLEQTSSGGACVNDALSHLAVPDLPFGGVGESGMGAYHGRAGFETFSHRKSVLDRATWPDVALRYPPYAGALKWIKRLIG